MNRILKETVEKIKVLNKWQIVTIGFIFLGISISIISIFNSMHIGNLNTEIENLNNQIARLEKKITTNTEEISGKLTNVNFTLTDALNQQKQNVGDIAQRLGSFSQEVGAVSNTVTTLQKLSKTDPQLLAKYSKIFFLNENYAPARLIEIPNKYKYSDSKPVKFHDQLWHYLQAMLDDASMTGGVMYVYSGYRSFDEQRALKGQYSITYGAGTANSFSADQGYSEHQLGTTVDLISPGLKGNLDGFDNTKSYEWLLANAYRYGFIESYPKNNKYYVFEPWHWRFVGVKLAKYLHDQNKNFYDLDQRAIDEYLVSFFD